MVLLDNIIEIFTVPNDDRGLVRLVVALDSRRVTTALIDRDFLGQPWVRIALRKNASAPPGHV